MSAQVLNAGVARVENDDDDGVARVETVEGVETITALRGWR